MSWREELRRVTHPDGRKLVGASFRGVPFFVESTDRGGGRRVVVHEFPLSDDPYVEDLGRKARNFRVEGYVLGDDYLAQKDALLAALEDVEGPGELVHPYYGARTAICSSLAVREQRADGGIAVFSLEFAEAPAQAPAPTAVVDSVGQVATSADAAIVASEAEFVERFNPLALPAFALTSAETALALAAEGLGAALGPIVTATQELAELTGRVAQLTATASSLVRQPSAVLGEFRAAIAGLAVTAATSPGSVVDALMDAFATDLGTLATAVTATRARELANQIALMAGLRQAMVIEAARLAPLASYDTIDEATEARDAIAAALEEQASTAGDTAYPALVNLRSELMRAVPGSAAFARVVTITRPVPIPSLLLAYQLYGSVDLEADIIARNRTPHPGFVAGGLQVLSDDV